ncbi:aldolase [Nocardia noduli]|uniref:aldolase n=1 Tax=Nocardia noduli TaxID=2815722 RepID=UPI001C235241|nr:aldolase [Nocardia noduli]
MDTPALIAGKQKHYTDLAATVDAVPKPTGSPAERVARACRVLARHGHGAGLAGQITARHDSAPDTFWTQSLGLTLDEAAADDQNRVTFQLELIEGRGPVNLANRFHGWIYAHRPDVAAIVHTHAKHSAALSMLGKPLTIQQMDVMPLYDDVGWLPSWPGVPYGDEEGRIILEALGDKRAILLAHHGLLTTGRSVEEAAYLATVFEHAARLQLLAMSAGTVCEVPADLGQDARAHAASEHYALAHYDALARALARDILR